MARVLYIDVATDRSGNIIQNAAVYLYQPGTTTAPLGLMYTTATGGTTQSNPLISDAGGLVKAWLDTTQLLDVKLTDNSNSAYYPTTPGSPLDFPDYTRPSVVGDPAHDTKATAAHAATAISFAPTGTIAGTNVQSALAEVASEAGSAIPTVPSYTKGALPTAGTAGRLARVTDTTRGVWVDDGAAWQALNAEVINFKDFGAVGDGVELTDVATTNGSATITSASASFTSADVGKAMTIAAAGSAGAALNGTISSITNSTTVVLSAAAGATTTGKGANYGTDNTPAFIAMLNATTATAGNYYYLSAGRYKFASTIPFNGIQYRTFKGANEARTTLYPPGNGALFTHSSLMNMHLLFEDFRIAGPQENPVFPAVTSPRSIGFLLTAPDSNQIHLNRVYFKELDYAITDQGNAVSFIYWNFDFVEFDNAPFKLSGAAAHNAITFNGCRWSATRRQGPAIEVSSGGTGTGTNNMFRDCVWESNHHEAARLFDMSSLVIENPYLEYNNDLGVDGLPYFNIKGSEILLIGGYMHCHNTNTDQQDIVIGNNQGTPIQNVRIINPGWVTYHPGAVQRANMPQLIEEYAGSVSFGTQIAPFTSVPTVDFKNIRLNGGVSLNKYFYTDKSWTDPASIAAGSSVTTTFSVPGAAEWNRVSVVPGFNNWDMPGGCSYYGWVSATDTVKVTLSNNSNDPVDPPTHNIRIQVMGP